MKNIFKLNQIKKVSNRLIVNQMRYDNKKKIAEIEDIQNELYNNMTPAKQKRGLESLAELDLPLNKRLNKDWIADLLTMLQIDDIIVKVEEPVLIDGVNQLSYLLKQEVLIYSKSNKSNLLHFQYVKPNYQSVGTDDEAIKFNNHSLYVKWTKDNMYLKTTSCLSNGGYLDKNLIFYQWQDEHLRELENGFSQERMEQINKKLSKTQKRRKQVR